MGGINLNTEINVNRRNNWLALKTGLIGVLLAGDLCAGSFEDTIRGLQDSHSDAVVTISATIEVNVEVTGQPARNQENTLEFPGTVVAPGVVVTSYSNTQPNVQLPNLPEGMKVNVSSEVKETRILWGNGDETDAEIILNDPDLDVSVLKAESSPEVVSDCLCRRRHKSSAA